MANALDLLIDSRRRRADTERTQAELITRGFENFTRGQARQEKNALEMLRTRASLAKSGLELFTSPETGNLDIRKTDKFGSQNPLLDELLKDTSQSGKSILGKLSDLQKRLPPGVRAEVGEGLSVTGTDPTLEEKKLTVSAAGIGESIDKAIDLVSQGVIDSGNVLEDALRGIAIDVGNPIFAGSDVEPLQSEVNNLKSTVTFARGGKALTGTEAKRLDVMLNVSGKDRRTILNDLSRFKTEFNRLVQINEDGSLTRRTEASKPAERKAALPQGVSEEDIQLTMREENMTREQVLRAIGVG